MPKIRIFRYDNTVLVRGNLEHCRVGGRLVTDLADMDRIVASRAEASREPWRQGVVDEELQAEATKGSCLSSTAAAA